MHGMEISVGSVPVDEAMNKTPKEAADRERPFNKKLMLIHHRWDLAGSDGGSPREM
jgi:hypothetical protein